MTFLPEDFGTEITIRKPEGAFFGGRRREDHAPGDAYALEDWKVHLAAEERRSLERGRERDRERVLAGRGVSAKRRRELMRQRRNRHRRRQRERQAKQAAQSRSTLPDEVTVAIGIPRGYSDYEAMELEDLRRHFRELLEEELKAVHAARLAEGKKRYMGVKAVLAQDPRDSAGSVRPTFARVPLIACKGDSAARHAILEELVAWRLRYRQALEARRHRLKSRAGTEHEVVFPLGTYHLLKEHRVRLRGVTRAPPALAA